MSVVLLAIFKAGGSAVFIQSHYTLNNAAMLGCFNPNLGQIWTNLNVGLKM